MKGKTKRIFAVMLACVMVFMCTACGAPAADKAITEGDLNITLTEDFTKSSYEGYDFVYESKKILFMGVCETQQEFNEVGMNIGTVDEYAKLCIEAHGTDMTVSSADSYKYCEYEEKVEGQDYSYYAAFYNHGTSYWVLTFATLKSDYENQKPTIEKFASSVTFNN